MLVAALVIGAAGLVVAWPARGRDPIREAQAEIDLGTARFHANDLDGAERHYLAAKAARPADARVHFNLARVAHERDAYGRAREGYLTALKLDPDLVDARLNLVVLTHRQGAHAEAAHHLAELRRRAPSDPRIAGLGDLLSTPSTKQ